MKKITSVEAARQFEAFAERAHNGEKFLVIRDGQPWVVLAPVTPLPPIPPKAAGLQWPDFAARLRSHYAEPVIGPTATELLADDKDDRF
jgi:hypothetical protein